MLVVDTNKQQHAFVKVNSEDGVAQWLLMPRSEETRNPTARDHKGRPVSLARVVATRRNALVANDTWKGDAHRECDYILRCIVGKTEEGLFLRKDCTDSSKFLWELFVTHGPVHISSVELLAPACFDFTSRVVKELHKGHADQAFTTLITHLLDERLQVNVPKALAMGTWVMRHNCDVFVRAMTDTTCTILTLHLQLDRQDFFGVPCESGYTPSLQGLEAVVVVVFHEGISMVTKPKTKHGKKNAPVCTRVVIKPNHPCIVSLDTPSTLTFENNNKSTNLAIGMLLGLITKPNVAHNQMVLSVPPTIDTNTQTDTQSLPDRSDDGGGDDGDDSDGGDGGHDGDGGDDGDDATTQMRTQIDKRELSQSLLPLCNKKRKGIF